MKKTIFKFILIYVIISVISNTFVFFHNKKIIENIENYNGDIMITKESELNEIIEKNKEVFIRVGKSAIENEASCFMASMLERGEDYEDYTGNLISENKEDLIYLCENCNIERIEFNPYGPRVFFLQRYIEWDIRKHIVNIYIEYLPENDTLNIINDDKRSKWWVKLYNHIYN